VEFKNLHAKGDGLEPQHRIRPGCPPTVIAEPEREPLLVEAPEVPRFCGQATAMVLEAMVWPVELGAGGHRQVLDAGAAVTRLDHLRSHRDRHQDGGQQHHLTHRVASARGADRTSALSRRP
jgi:hypothetical protein